jgi:hypothetical protein
MREELCFEFNYLGGEFSSVDRDIKSCSHGKIVQRRSNLCNGLVMADRRYTESGNDADRILIDVPPSATPTNSFPLFKRRSVRGTLRKRSRLLRCRNQSMAC